ncbi:protein of unknown function (DUF3395) [Carpediemonas membranifera]|uniref:J domain-containing protein n=1 Tax=Carpediemonas membranifera TaxID=201153 RepID=A0A8J6ATE1_9EUKA|nr:protein of unknown function (DUF3395) [Carpediemonas membranifera]|eukprot:KAG9394096.1 protein of unknown function (DUF3395) [Carpediemonas membranifera]
MSESLYTVLGVDPSVDQRQLRLAYFKLARKHDPDRKSSDEREEATKLSAKLNEAYKVLSDPLRRAIYDEFGAGVINSAQCISQVLHNPPPSTLLPASRGTDSILSLFRRPKVSFGLAAKNLTPLPIAPALATSATWGKITLDAHGYLQSPSAGLSVSAEGRFARAEAGVTVTSRPTSFLGAYLKYAVELLPNHTVGAHAAIGPDVAVGTSYQGQTGNTVIRLLTKASAAGMSFMVDMTHNGSVFMVPVVFARRPTLKSAALFFTAAVLSAVSAKLYAVYNPFDYLENLDRRRRYNQAITRIKARGMDSLDQTKAAAEREVKMMSHKEGHRINWPSRRQALISVGWLVVTRAVYGPRGRRGPSHGRLLDGMDGDEYAEVSIQLQSHVSEVRLSKSSKQSSPCLFLTGGTTKATLPGFYDPCFGVEKGLYIEYSFKGALHAVYYSDHDKVELPMAAHKVKG